MNWKYYLSGKTVRELRQWYLSTLKDGKPTKESDELAKQIKIHTNIKFK